MNSFSEFCGNSDKLNPLLPTWHTTFPIGLKVLSQQDVQQELLAILPPNFSEMRFSLNGQALYSPYEKAALSFGFQVGF